MADRHQTDHDVFSDVARIVAGLGMLAAAAMAARKQGAKHDTRPGTRSLNDLLRNRPAPRRKPPEAGIAVPAISPRGPLPKQGGAAASLEFGA